MKVYLIENYSSDIKLDENSLIVALTPEVCYQLDRVGITYSTIEDYYDEAELLADEDSYYESQLRWIGELDEFLKDNVAGLKELDLRLGSIYYFWIKTYVLDPLYIRCYTLRSFFERVKPSDVIFISAPPGKERLSLMLEDVSKSYCSQLIPLYCRDRNIPFKAVLLRGKDGNHSLKKPVEAGLSFTYSLKRAFAKSETIKSVYYLYRYLRKQPFLQQRSQNILDILIIRGGYNIVPDFRIDALKRGHRVYELANDFIVKESPFGSRRHYCLRKGSALQDNIWQQAADLVQHSDLIKKVNEQCRLDVSEIILPRLSYFISSICPEIVTYFKDFMEFYAKKKIDFVLAPLAYSIVEHGALAAANSRGINTVCLDHGDDIFASIAWRVCELKNFSILIASNRESREYYECLCKANNIPGELYISPHRLLHVEKIRELREKSRSKIKGGRIIYLPNQWIGDRRRLSSNWPPSIWYYRFQKSLIEHFSTRPEYTFVWKGLPQSDAAHEPIPDFITDSNFTNIEISTMPFIEHLLSADKVICDFPSTGFYESVVAGVPTMSLYHKGSKVRTPAVEHFGNLLKPYADIPEAIRHIDEFLNSDPELYKTTIDMGDEQVINILEKIAEKGTASSPEQARP
jgi:hypothetical protein